MLFKAAVKESTLELLTKLMQDACLANFILVGGTALALQIGHRDSIDIHLFSQEPFNESDVFDHLQGSYNFIADFIDRNILKGEVQGVKVDLITHKYPNVGSVLELDGIRMASKSDIAAMKLNAIVRDGSRIKDFIDIAYLSSFLSFYEMQQAYVSKYANSNPEMISKALIYHEDINFKEPIKMLDGKLDWNKIAQRLSMMMSKPHKLLPSLSR